MSRDKKFALALGVVAVAALAAVGARVLIGPGPDVATVAAVAETNGDGNATITFGGDTMLGDQADRLLAREGYDVPFRQLGGMLDADYVIVNAEAPITTLTKWYDPRVDYSYNTLPPAAQALADAWR